jgi:hypothetical protein
MLFNDEVSCYASGRQHPTSGMPERWACADVATYQTMSNARAGGLLFGQQCPGTPPGEIYGDRVADAHDMRVILVRLSCPSMPQQSPPPLLGEGQTPPPYMLHFLSVAS